MRFMKRIVMLLFLSVMVCTLSAQEKKGETIGERIVANAYNADSIRGILDKMPYFTLFKDNYFVGGTTLGHKPTAANSDVKFQLSIAQRLTKSKLPFDTYLFIQYTQKAFWNVFQESLPMKDLNFNPVRFMFEHKISFTYIFIMVDDQMPQTDTGIKIKVLHG